MSNTYTLALNVTSGAAADGKDTNKATVTLSNGTEWVGSATINFLVTGSAKFANGSQMSKATTDTLGRAVVTFTDNIAESVIITALSDTHEVSQNGVSTFAESGSGGTDDYQLTVTATSGAAPDGDATNDVTVTLTDKQGAPLARQIIDLSVSGSAQFADGATTTVITDKNGSHVVTITDTAEEKVTITAVMYDDDGTTVLAEATGTSSFGQADSDYHLSVTATSGAAPNGLSTNNVKVTITDKKGTPLQRKIIDLAVNKNAYFKDGSSQTLSLVTDAEGQHQTGILDEFEEIVTVTAQYLDDDGSILASAKHDSGFGQANSAYTMELKAETGVPADGKSENSITITLKDKESGAPVHLAIIQMKAGGNASFTNSGQQTDEGVTNVNGQATFLLTDTVSESVHLMAAFLPVGEQMIVVESDTYFGEAQNYHLVVGAKDGAQANGKDTNEVTVTLKNSDGQPTKGALIKLSVDGGAVLSNGTGDITVTTNGNGQALETLTDVIAETVIISANYSEGNVTAKGSSTFVEIQEKYILTVVAEDGAKANGKDTNAVTVKLINGNGDAVSGAQIILTVSGNALLSNGSGTRTLYTNNMGQIHEMLTDVTAETVIVSANYNDENIQAQDSSQFTYQPSELFEDFELNQEQSLYINSPITLVRSGSIMTLVKGDSYIARHTNMETVHGNAVTGYSSNEQIITIDFPIPFSYFKIGLYRKRLIEAEVLFIFYDANGKEIDRTNTGYFHWDLWFEHSILGGMANRVEIIVPEYYMTTFDNITVRS